MDTVGSTGDEQVEERLESREVVWGRGKAQVTFEGGRHLSSSEIQGERHLSGGEVRRGDVLSGSDIRRGAMFEWW